MIKKFTDEDNTNVYIFISSDDKLVLCCNGECEYTMNSIVTMPQTLEEALKIIGLDIWYPIDE